MSFVLCLFENYDRYLYKYMTKYLEFIWGAIIMSPDCVSRKAYVSLMYINCLAEEE